MLQVSSLTKVFRLACSKRARGERDPRERGRRFHAIDGIEFGVRRGQVLGLLGQNGAGKTTLLRILSTSLKPTSGVVLCDGEDLTKNPLEIRKRIGFVSGNTGLYGRLTAREMLRYYGKLHGMSRRRARRAHRVAGCGSWTWAGSSTNGTRRFPPACGRRCPSRGRWFTTRKSCSSTS